MVRALVRSIHKMPFVREGLEVFTGSITDADAVFQAVRNCDAVIHIAADTRQHFLNYKHYVPVNVEGTRGLIEAARIHQVRRFIQVSSANTRKNGTKEDPGTESGRFCYPFTRSGYARSKFESENMVLQHALRYNMDVVVVNPCFLIGPYDARPSSGKIVLRGYRKRVLLIPPGGKNFIHVADAAAAIRQALEKGKSGACYLLAGENMSYREFYRQLSEVTKTPCLLLTIPAPCMRLIGTLGSMLAACGIKNAFYLNNMRILCLNNYYSGQKAITELGMKQTEVKTAIADALSWFRKAGIRSKDRGART